MEKEKEKKKLDKDFWNYWNGVNLGTLFTTLFFYFELYFQPQFVFFNTYGFIPINIISVWIGFKQIKKLKAQEKPKEEKNEYSEKYKELISFEQKTKEKYEKI